MKILENLLENVTVKKECNVILSAGGVRCLAQVGALKALEADGWSIKSICGISAGSIVASMYCYGITLDQMVDIGLNAKFTNYRTANFKNIGKGVFKIDALGKWVLDCCVKHGDYSEPKCELNIVTCSITTGNKLILTNPVEEELVSAVNASCCIPVLFELIPIGDELYADGALWSSAPVHFYIDSNLPTFVIHMQNDHSQTFINYSNPVQLLYRVFEVFQINRLKSLKKRIYNKPIYIIEPSAEGVSAFDFKVSKAIRSKIITGAEQETLNFLKEHSLSGKKYSLF